MAKFDVLGTMLLMYEVPYIAVPTLKDSDLLSDKEVEKLSPLEEIEVKIKQRDVKDPELG